MSSTDAQIIDLAEWKAAHPPALRCWNAAVRCWWNWASLAWYPWQKVFYKK
jgi:hypothetical protein